MWQVRLSVVVSSLARGGAEKVAVQLCNAFAARGAKIQVITVMGTADPLELHRDIELETIEKRKISNHIAGRILDNVQRVSQLTQHIRRYKPNVIIGHADRTNILAILAGRKLKIPVIATDHNHPDLHAIGRGWSLLRRYAYPKADKIVGVSKGIIADLPGRLQEKAVCIYNPVILPEITASPDIGGRHFVAMGRLTHQKGFDLLIDAFAAVVRKHHDATLTILGEGEERTRLERQIAALSLQERVDLPGFSTRPFETIAEKSVFVFPSRYEGFGLALAEALGVGLPVIAANCKSGPAEMIEHGVNGLLVAVNDPNALSGAMLDLLDNPELARNLAAGALRQKERFNLDPIVEEWQHVIEAVMRK